MRRLTRWEIGTVAGFLLVYTVVSLLAKPGAALTAFSDMSGTGLWFVAVAVMLWAAFSNTGRTRWFWFLMRSEEHTSELQSQFHLVCRLLLEKKKKNKLTTYPAA